MEKINLKTVLITITLGILVNFLSAVIADYLAPKFIIYLIGVSQSFDEQIFRQIATRDTMFLQKSTLSIIYLFFFNFLIFMSFLLYYFFSLSRLKLEGIKARAIKIREDVYQEKNNIVEVSIEEVEKNYENLMNGISKSEKSYRKLSLFLVVVVSLTVFGCVFMYFYAQFKNNYVYDSISYYNYLLRVNSVSLSDQEERYYTTKFTQIKNKNDYLEIIKDLELKAFENNLGVNIYPNARKENDILSDHRNYLYGIK